MRTRFLLCALALIACGDDDGAAPDLDAGVPIDATTPVDATTPGDATFDAATPEPDCFADPKTYLEIINACTDAEKVTKDQVLPLIGADGKLPPLP